MATTDTWDSPALDQPINADLPAIKNKFQALVKGDPSLVQNPPVGAKRLVEIDSGNWQVQQYNGSTWSNIGKLKMDVDTVDGYDAAITPQANTIAVRNASGMLEGDITGNAVSADSAATLSETLGVELGGTGTTTAAQARQNLGVPPTSHASTATTHGVGNGTVYGHVKLSDAVDSTSGASGGVAASSAAAKTAYDKGVEAKGAADAALQMLATPATSTTLGPVKVGDGLTTGEDGTLSLDLVDGVDSTSTTQAPTAAAVKKAYDKASELDWIGVPRYWRSTNLPPNHCWANGDFVAFADWPELKALHDAGGFAGMLMAWDADSETQAANLGKWRPDAANPTGLYTPDLTGQFLRSWTQGGGEAGRSVVDTGRGMMGSINIGTSRGSLGAWQATGPFTTLGSSSVLSGGDSSLSSTYGINFDSSKSWGADHTGEEFAPQHVSLPMIIYLGNPA